jgi:hypothetical protein
MTDDDWYELKNDIKFIYNTDNYFWDLKETEILAERMKILSFVEPYLGKYFSVEYVRRKILRQTEQELQELDKQMAEDNQKLQAQQMALMAQQQIEAQGQEEQQ